MDKSIKILVVEDSIDDAELYGRLLRTVPGYTYNCTNAGEAGEALDLLAGERFECAIIDYTLPGMDGLALLKRMREQEKFMPLVMLTGQARDDLAPAILESGANTYLDKANIDQAALHNAISAAIRACAAARLVSQPQQRPILIIDDNADDREAYIRMLKSTSYALAGFVEAADGASGLAELQKRDFEAVLLDYEMPGLNGLGVLSAIRRQSPSIPVLFVTGIGSVTIAVAALQGGASDYLVKSNLDAERLSRALSDCVMKATVAAKDAEILAKNAEIAQSEANARLILDNSRDVISRVGPDGRRLYISSAAQRVFGISPKDFTGSTFLTHVHPEDFVTLSNAQARLVSGDLAECSMAFRIRHAELGERWVETCAVALRDDMSRPAGYISVTRDVTDRVRMEREREARGRELRLANLELDRLARDMSKARAIAEQASRAKTRFLAGMSHELRTPLNGILGYAQLLQMDGGLTPIQASRVEAMLSAGTHLLEMISCVLDLSEIETDGIDLQIAPLDIVRLAEACLDIVRPAAEAKCLALRLCVGGGVPRAVMGSTTRLRQVLLNLLGNAVKYTPGGSVELRLKTVEPGADGARPSGGKPWLRLEVADTGPGIPPAKRHLLFEEFERLDAASSTTAEGAGLGLSLAKRLAALMGGELGYADNPVGGSVFFLDIPLVAAAAAPAEGEAVQRQPPAAPLPQTAPHTRAGMPILVVDDGAMNRNIASEFIRSAGYEVMCAEDGKQAVDLAAAADYQLILMDVRMPGMDGLEATRRIRSLGGQRACVPILALTAQAFTEQIAECREAGMDGHVGKPFTLDSLLKSIALHVATVHAPKPAFQPPPAGISEPEAVKLVGSDLPALNFDTFNKVASMMKPGVVQGFLGKLEHLIDTFRTSLSGCDFQPGAALPLAAEAHFLGGTAGMLGFDRLNVVCAHFERVVQTAPADVAGLADGLDQALLASLSAVRNQLQIATRPPGLSPDAPPGQAPAIRARDQAPLPRRMTSQTMRDLYGHWQRIQVEAGRLPNMADLQAFEHRLAVDGFLLTLEGSATDPKFHVRSIGTALTKRLGKDLAGSTLKAEEEEVLISAHGAYRRCLTGKAHFDYSIISLGSFGKLRFERLLLPISEAQGREHQVAHQVAHQVVGLAIFEDFMAGSDQEKSNAADRLL